MFFTLIYIFVLIPIIYGSENLVSQYPVTACPGESVTVVCSLNVPDSGDVFIRPITGFILGDDIVSNSSGILNTSLCSNNTSNSSNIFYPPNFNNPNISNLSINTPVGNSSRVFGFITLDSYSSNDSSLEVGCINYFYDDGNCSVVSSVNETLQLLQAETPSGSNCSINDTYFDPNTCNLRYSLTWTAPYNKVNGESFQYNLLESNSLLYSVNSADDIFNISNISANTPGNSVNLTLRAENCAGGFSTLCFQDVIPRYEIVIGSVYITFSPQTYDFAYSWELERYPPNSSNRVLSLTYKINVQADYKYNEQNISFTQSSGDMTRNFLSNVTNTTETFVFNQPGTDLRRIDLFLKIQIVEQCGYNISGDVFNAYFTYIEPPTGFNCSVVNSNINPNTCNLPYTFRWTSPVNKLDTDSLYYTLLTNNVSVITITSMSNYLNFSDDTIITPGKGVNYTLSVENSAGVSTIQCSADIIPLYELINGSTYVTYSIQTNNFTFNWELMRFPTSAFEHVTALTFQINLQIKYKFNEETMPRSENITYSEVYLSTISTASRMFDSNQVGLTLGRLDVSLNIQIVQQCNSSLSGAIHTAAHNFADPPTGLNCSVHRSLIDPYTCNLPYSFIWTSPVNKFATDSLIYDLKTNNVIVNTIDSPDSTLQYPNHVIIGPGKSVNFSLTAMNFADITPFQCFTDVIPSYEFVNGSINIAYSKHNNFTFNWELMRSPMSASEHITALIFKINIQIEYKFNEESTTRTHSISGLERTFLSNITSASEILNVTQAGLTLGRLDAYHNVQIVRQCGMNTSGSIYNSVLRYADPPTGLNCSVQPSPIDPYTCNLPYTFIWNSPVNKFATDSLIYDLMANNAIVNTINSPDSNLRYPNKIIIGPGKSVNFSLTAMNFADVTSFQCFTDVIPSYEFVNGSISIRYYQQNNFTYTWELMRSPMSASEHITALIFKINIQIEYKFNEESTTRTHSISGLERTFLSNITSASEIINVTQVGLTLGRLDAYHNVQIVRQCGMNTSGSIYHSVFSYADPPTGLNCSIQRSVIDPYTCNLPYTFIWTSPVNKFAADSLRYDLFTNSVSVHAINSTLAYFNYSDDINNRPGEIVNFTLTANNFAGTTHMLCFAEVTPSYEIQDGSISVSFAPDDNNFIFSWELLKSPVTAPEYLIELTYSIQLQVDFKFAKDISYTQTTSSITKNFLSNVTIYNETLDNPLGFILENVGVSFNIQIVQQCAHNTSGNAFNVLFNYTGPFVCKSNCNDTDMDSYPDQLSICPQLNRTCLDNCPLVPNPDQLDCDDNGVGDVCDNTCEPEIDSIFELEWGCSKGGEVVMVRCSDGGNNAIRKCLMSGDWSDDIDTTLCISSNFANIMNGSTSFENLDITETAIRSQAPVYSGDIISIGKVLLSTLDDSNNIQAILGKTVDIVHHLADDSNLQILNQTQLHSNIAQEILGVLESQAGILVNQSLELRLDDLRNIFFETRMVDSDVLITADNIHKVGQLSPSVEIPINPNSNSRISVSVIVVRNIAKVIGSFSESTTVGATRLKLSSFSQLVIVTPLISVQIFSDNQLVTTSAANTMVTLNFPLDLSQIDKSREYFRPTCLFLADSSSNNSQWKDDGISDVSMKDVDSDNVLTCNSGHTTAFVVLIGINNFDAKQTVLNVYTYFGCVVAIICLLLTLAIYLLFGRGLLKKIRHFIFFQLALSVCLLYLVFLLGLEFAYANVWHYIPCKFVTVLLEYLILVVFLLILFESVIVLMMINLPKFIFTTRHYFIFSLPWLLPILYVILFIPFFHPFYLTPPNNTSSLDARYCWVYHGQGTYYIYTFVVPLALIVFVNMCTLVYVFVRIIRLFFKKKSLKSLLPVRKNGLKLLCIIIVVFALLVFGWTFGFLAIYLNYVIFSVLFTIASLSQGIFFLLLLLIRPDIHLSISNTFDLQTKISKFKSKLSAKRAKKKDPFRDITYIEEPKYLPEVNSDWDLTTHYIDEREDWRSKVRELEAASSVNLPSTSAFEKPIEKPTYPDEKSRKSDILRPSTSRTGSAVEIVSMMSFYEEKPRESKLEKVVEETPDGVFDKIRKDLDDIMTQVTELELEW